MPSVYIYTTTDNTGILHIQEVKLMVSSGVCAAAYVQFLLINQQERNRTFPFLLVVIATAVASAAHDADV